MSKKIIVRNADDFLIFKGIVKRQNEIIGGFIGGNVENDKEIKKLIIGGDIYFYNVNSYDLKNPIPFDLTIKNTTRENSTVVYFDCLFYPFCWGVRKFGPLAGCMVYSDLVVFYESFMENFYN
jgi:hypothetical protein